MKAAPVLIIFLFLFSCNPETENGNYAVIIGESGKNYTIIKPNPEILVTVSHQDSLDLNSDGIFEIRFTIAPIKTSTEPGSETIISTRNKLQILLSDLMYQDPDTLNIRTTLNSNSNWSEPDPNWSASTTYNFTLRSYACYTYNHCLSHGNFESVTGKYIGYKIGNGFGWILVDSNFSELKIKEYTVLR
jgi:hypothetical protein